MRALSKPTSNLSKLLFLASFLTVASVALAKTTWYVDGVSGNDSNDCTSQPTACATIGHAISLARSGDTVMVAPATYTENLAVGVNLRIMGASAATTIVDGNQTGTVLTVSGVTTRVDVSKLTFRNGYSQTFGGGVYNGGVLTINNSTITANISSDWGGGISNWGTLTISNSTITANSAVYGGGGIWSSNTALTVNHCIIAGNSARDSGGGIYSGGTLTVNQSTITGNSADDGGGIYSGGALAINNSTIEGNSAGEGGGGIDVVNGAATMTNSTVTANNALANGGGIFNYVTLMINNSTIAGNTAAVSGGISQQTADDGWVTLQNSVIANNSGGNCPTPPGEIFSNGYNLSSDGTCSFNGPGDMNGVDAKLGQLGNYGGPTQTMPLLTGSPAIDAGNPNGCTDASGNLLTTDQRGKPRPDKEDSGGCDMGAFERQSN